MPKGEFNFTFENLPIGVHTITVNYTGTPLNTPGNGSQMIYYKPVVKTTEIEVKPIPVSPELKANAEDIYEGQEATVIVTINENITGNVTINVNGEDRKITIVKGKGTINITDLTQGYKEFEISFEGDKYFLAETSKVNFTVKAKEDPELRVNLNEDKVTIGEKVIVNVLINSEVTGEVTINNQPINILNGEGNYTFTDLAVGNYTYTVSFKGDARFNPDAKEVSFNITLKDAGLTVNADSVVVDNNVTITVHVDENVKGKVTISIDGEDKVIDINNGIGEYTLSGLSVGEYTYNVTFEGDELFSADKKPVSFNVKPIEAEIIIMNAENEYKTGNFTFKVINTEDGTPMTNVTVKLTSTSDRIKVVFNAVTDDNGIASFKTAKLYEFILGPPSYYLKVGKHIFEVEIDDAKINASKLNANLTITPAHYKISINDYNEDYGSDNNLTFTVTNSLGEMITDEWFKINIPENDDNDYYSYVNTDGIGAISLKNVLPGKYEVKISNNNTEDIINTTSTKNVTIKELDAGFTADAANIMVGKNATITVKINREYLGIIIINVDGENKTISITDGEGSYIIPGLSVGEYNYTISYMGDKRFASGNQTVRFNVTAKHDAGANITIPEKITGDGFDIVIGEGATGEILVTIDGNTTSIPLVNGTAKVDLSKLAPGNHNITLRYDGDENYGGFEKNATVTIASKEPETVPVKIIANDLTVQYSDGTKYTVTVYGSDGNLAVNAPVVFKINGKKVATVKTNAKGVAALKITQTPKTYKVTAEALGESVTKKLTVKQILTLKKVKVKRSAKKLVLKATLKKVKGKYLKGKKIVFKFKGKKYTAKTNKKGVAKVTIKKKVLKKLKKGKKVTYSATYLKTTVKKTVKVK